METQKNINFTQKRKVHFWTNFNLFCPNFGKTRTFKTRLKYPWLIAFEKDGLTNKMTEISGFIGPSEALTRKCSVKKVFLEISQNHSVHWGINPPKNTTPPPFLPSLPLNLSTVQAPSFKVIPPIYWFFANPA